MTPVHSEHECWQTFEHARDAIFIADVKTGKIIDCNLQATKLLKLPKKKILGLHQSALHPKGEANKYKTLFRRHIRSLGKVPVVGEVLSHDGTRIPVEINASVFKRKNGQVVAQGIFRDISDRVLIDEMLRESAERFRAAFDSSAIGMALVSPAGAWLQVNPALCRLLGYSEKELLRLKFQDVTHPDDLATSLTALKRMHAGKISHARFEKRYVRKDKGIKWVMINVSIVRDAKRNPKYFVTEVDDITDTKRAQEKLMESEEKFRTLTDNSPVGVYLIQKDIFQYVNPTFARIFGYETKELIGRLGPRATIVPADWPLVRKSMQERLAGKQDTVRYRFSGLTRDGKVIRIEVFGARMMYKKKPAIIGTALDVTLDERKDIELRDRAKDLEKFQLAVAGASDHVMITDPNGYILYANKAAERMTGYSVDEMLGHHAGQLWGGHMKKSFYEDMWRTIKAEKKTFKGELQNVRKSIFKAEIMNQRKSGEAYVAEATISPILDEHGDVMFFVGVERDVTKAKEIDRMKSEFISVASHQLRTPLSTAGWYTEMLLTGDAGPTTPDQHRFLQEIARANQRSITLINSLLSVSRLDTGKMLAQPKSTNVPTVARTIIRSLLPLAERNRVTVQTSFDLRVPNLLIDPEILGLVLQNLLSNAIKYSRENGFVRLEAVLQGPNVLLRVIDNGLGIPQNVQERIFTKFFRANNARKKDPDGTGLGLYIVKSAAELAGGTVRFESEEGKGTAFFVTIPISGKTNNNHWNLAAG